MNPSEKILRQINRLTTDIETNYPELYHFLEEQALTIPLNDHSPLNENSLEDYMGSLKQLLKHHLEIHNRN